MSNSIRSKGKGSNWVYHKEIEICNLCMLNAVVIFIHRLSDLIYGPRLQPLWLNLVTSDARTSHKIAESMLSDLCSVLSVGDTKNTNL